MSFIKGYFGRFKALKLRATLSDVLTRKRFFDATFPFFRVLGFLGQRGFTIVLGQCSRSAGPQLGSLNVGAWNPQESGRKAPLSCDFEKSSRRLWWSQRRKSSSVPAEAATFPAAVLNFLAGKCSNLGRDSISRCWKIGESFSSSVEICRKTLPAGNLGQPQPFRVFSERCSFFSIARCSFFCFSSFICCSTAFGKNDVRIAAKRMLQCNFCSAAFFLFFARGTLLCRTLKST